MRTVQLFLCFCLFHFGLGAENFSSLQQTISSLNKEQTPFSYDLKLTLVKGHSENEKVLLLLHGMGGDYKIAPILKAFEVTPDHLISFNFPDANFQYGGERDPNKTTMGSIGEILPALYILKKLIVDGGLKSLDVYGFSAGGGALVNAIAALNSTQYDRQLASININLDDKISILNALQQGTILLDAPLKSMREIHEAKGGDSVASVMGRRYRENNFEPIDNLEKWQGLSLRVLIYFETPDKILTNRDDALFVNRLKTYDSKGSVQFFKGKNGGHLSIHTPLWHAYNSIVPIN